MKYSFLNHIPSKLYRRWSLTVNRHLVFTTSRLCLTVPSSSLDQFCLQESVSEWPLQSQIQWGKECKWNVWSPTLRILTFFLTCYLLWTPVRNSSRVWVNVKISKLQSLESCMKARTRNNSHGLFPQYLTDNWY